MRTDKSIIRTAPPLGQPVRMPDNAAHCIRPGPRHGRCREERKRPRRRPRASTSCWLSRRTSPSCPPASCSSGSTSRDRPLPAALHAGGARLPGVRRRAAALPAGAVGGTAGACLADVGRPEAASPRRCSKGSGRKHARRWRCSCRRATCACASQELPSPQPLNFKRGVGYTERLGAGATGRAILAWLEPTPSQLRSYVQGTGIDVTPAASGTGADPQARLFDQPQRADLRRRGHRRAFLRRQRPRGRFARRVRSGSAGGRRAAKGDRPDAAQGEHATVGGAGLFRAGRQARLSLGCPRSGRRGRDLTQAMLCP